MTQNFLNDEISLQQLPVVDEINMNRLNRQYFKLVLFWAVLRCILCFILGIAILYSINNLIDSVFWNQLKYVILTLFIGLGFLNILFSVLGFKYKGYALRQYDVIYKSGFINKIQVVIPFNRVQHVEVYEGFLPRLLGLCELTFFTAGGALGNLTIPGLKIGEAEVIKEFVITKIQSEIDSKVSANE